MNLFLRQVEDFHRSIGAPVGLPFPSAPDPALIDLGVQLIDLAKALEAHGDAGLRRISLTLEETGEWVAALGQANEVLALDALADRAYVLLGDAVTWDLPLEAALREVCRSNASKRPQEGDPAAWRVRQKGPAYSPPDMAGALAAHRAGRMGIDSTPNQRRGESSASSVDVIEGDGAWQPLDDEFTLEDSMRPLSPSQRRLVQDVINMLKFDGQEHAEATLSVLQEVWRQHQEEEVS